MSEEFARITASFQYSLLRFQSGEDRRQRGEELTRKMLARATWQLDVSKELLKQPQPKITPNDREV